MTDKTTTHLKDQDLPKMYVRAAEAKALGLPSADEQVRRWNELQKQIREIR